MRRVLILCVCLLAGACAPDPMKWEVPDFRSATALPVGAKLTVNGDGRPAITAAWTPPAVPTGQSMCGGSLVATQAHGDTAYAAWWAPRADSTALLLVARSEDGGRSWRAPEVADSTDKGRTGCGRPAPSIAADSTNGYVHVVYFMVAAEGPGIFFTHSMTNGEMFHSPVAIMYGERASAAAVACNGDTVAVAYLDPNAVVPQVWLALSYTTGHIFEERLEASPSTVQAGRPAVGVQGHHVAIAWLETGREGGKSTTVERTGLWR